MKDRKNIGLALGGGAVLGAAHVGVLEVLEEEGVEVSCLAGTSIGAFVGAFYAFGIDCATIKEIASSLKWMDIGDLSLSKYGLLSNEKMGDLIIEHIGDKQLEDAEIPIAMVATDVTTGSKIVLKKGSVKEAVMASTCIPGIFQPITISGSMLVDGGIVENVPIQTVKEMGAEYIIGVDLNAKHSYTEPTNILGVITNSFHFIMQQSVALQTGDADLMIEPNLSSFSRSDTDQVKELIKKGYGAAKGELK